MNASNQVDCRGNGSETTTYLSQKLRHPRQSKFQRLDVSEEEETKKRRRWLRSDRARRLEL